MARIVDSLVFSALAFIGFLAALLQTGRDARLCALLSLLAAGCVFIWGSFLLEKIPRLSFHRRRTRAAKRVRAWIYDEAQYAHEGVFALLSERYPVKDPSFARGFLRFTHMNIDQAGLAVIQKLKAAPDDILKTWRDVSAEGGLEALVIAVPGRSDSDIRVLASRLSHPDVIILDRHQLVRLMRRSVQCEAPSAKVRSPHPLKALTGYISRGRALRYAAYGLLLTACYVLTGKAAYLISGMLLAYLTCFCLIRPREPKRLIERFSPARPDECANPRAPRDK